ncbi:unnamed protein product [Closterium sp. NIES-53]
MLGNVCEACGLEHVDDNTLQSHVSNNIKCRRKIQHSCAQRLVEAYRDALRARCGARPQTPVRYTNNNGGASASGGEVDPAAVVDEPDDPIDPAEESDGEESVMSHIDDGFNTLIELYIFFREADLSRREVNRLLSIFQNPKFSLRDVRRWLNFMDVRRFGRERAPVDQVAWKTKGVKCYRPRGRMCTLLLHYRDTELASMPDEDCIVLGVIVYSDSMHASRNGRLAAWPVLISLYNISEALRWQEPGHLMAGVLPFPPNWASSTEKTRVLQVCMEVILEPLLRAHRG